MIYDAVIVGAGPSGLAAGIRLAYFDYKVLILERHHRVGGLNSYYRRQGRDYDVGLHALTNFAPPGVKDTPWPRLLRQLRLRPGDFHLDAQRRSEIRFPGATLAFTNEPAFFESEVCRLFPDQADGFRRLIETMGQTDALSLDAEAVSARQTLSQFLSNPQLIEMLFCPLMFYGSAVEEDMDFAQFVIMYQSIFQEGLSRPRGGVRPLLDCLTDKYEALGGELRLRAGVRQIVSPGGDEPVRLILDNGEEVLARTVLSSAGHPETLALGGQDWNKADGAPSDLIGRLAFVEIIFSIQGAPTEVGLDTSIVFFNEEDHFAYRRPDALIDTRSGVLCCPDNFGALDDEPTPPSTAPESMIRLTHLANYDRWKTLSAEDYTAAKARALEEAVATLKRQGVAIEGRVVATDMFTPLSVERFTSRLGGAVYGTPRKHRQGTTPFPHVFLCGADQGFLGIVGSMLSGVTMANNHVIYAKK